MSDINTGVQTRSKLRNFCAFYAFLSNIEPKNVHEALADSNRVTAMQVELHQFERNKVWHLELRLKDKLIISTKWAFKNKLGEFGIVTRNKARLVVQGYNQKEGTTMRKHLHLLQGSRLSVFWWPLQLTWRSS